MAKRPEDSVCVHFVQSKVPLIEPRTRLLANIHTVLTWQGPLTVIFSEHLDAAAVLPAERMSEQLSDLKPPKRASGDTLHVPAQQQHRYVQVASAFQV